MLRALLNIIYPPFCDACGVKLRINENHICTRCLGKIRVLSPPLCRLCSRQMGYLKDICNECKNRTSHIDRAWSWALYDDLMKKCIHIFKYKKSAYMPRIFSARLYEFIDANNIVKDIDIIAPIPLHRKRFSERSFNQSEIIAKLISKHYKIECKNALLKTKNTIPQNTLNKIERFKNIKGSFILKDKNSFRKKKILLVDDIFTTGSTVNECARIARMGGSDKVYAFTLARGL